MCGLPPDTRVINGTAPRPRALTAGSDKLPPSIRFHTTFSTEKFFTGECSASWNAFKSPSQKFLPVAYREVIEASLLDIVYFLRRFRSTPVIVSRCMEAGLSSRS